MSFTRCLLVLLCLTARGAGAADLQALFDGAITDIGGKSPIPIYLPTVLPEAIARYDVKRAIGDATDSGYVVSLFFSEEPSDATFAARISGSTKKTVGALPNTVVVKLLNGASAQFRPVQCGGSCAPANLWWQVEGVEYSVQLKLRSDLRVETQREAMIEAASSMALVQ
jgi:hypothetical protein